MIMQKCHLNGQKNLLFHVHLNMSDYVFVYIYFLLISLQLTTILCFKEQSVNCVLANSRFNMKSNVG